MFKRQSNFKHSVRVRSRVWVRVRFRVGFRVRGSGLGLVRFRVRVRVMVIKSDIENNIWRHLLNILNDRIVEVLRFSVTF